MWSQKTRYALRALIAFSSHPGVPVSVREVAETHGIPQKYLEAILADLRADGLVRSTKGPRGGYLLGRSPEHISMEDVLCAVDPEFLAVESDDGAPEEDVVRALTTPFLRRLGETSIADAARLWHGRRQVLDYVI